MQAAMRFTLAGIVSLGVAATAHAQPTGGKEVVKQIPVAAPSHITAAPWFNNEKIRTELKLTPEQFKKLDSSYGQYYKRYQTDMSGLAKIAPAQRDERLAQLNSTFNSNIATIAKDTLTPEQAQRYNQLYYQYRGYDAWSDPEIVRKLDLTEKQRGELLKYAREYDQKWTTIYGSAEKDREAATRSYMELRREHNQRIDKLLAEEQRRAWRDITGSPYEFQPDFSRQIKTPLTPGSP